MCFLSCGGGSEELNKDHNTKALPKIYGAMLSTHCSPGGPTQGNPGFHVPLLAPNHLWEGQQRLWYRGVQDVPHTARSLAATCSTTEHSDSQVQNFTDLQYCDSQVVRKAGCSCCWSRASLLADSGKTMATKKLPRGRTEG